MTGAGFPQARRVRLLLSEDLASHYLVDRGGGKQIPPPPPPPPPTQALSPPPPAGDVRDAKSKATSNGEGMLPAPSPPTGAAPRAPVLVLLQGGRKVRAGGSEKQGGSWGNNEGGEAGRDHGGSGDQGIKERERSAVAAAQVGFCLFVASGVFVLCGWGLVVCGGLLLCGLGFVCVDMVLRVCG